MRAADLVRPLSAKRSGRQWVCKCVAHEDSSPSMIFFDGHEEGRVQVRCMAGCEPEDIIAVLRSRGLWDEASSTERAMAAERHNPREQEEEKKNHRMRVLARAIFDDAKPIKGSLAEIYFEFRGVHDVARMIDDIRYHPACPCGDRKRPAVVIAFRSVATSAVVAIQRLFLTRHGRKEGKGMMLAPTGGAAMMLQRLQNHTLHICEGLETGLSLVAMDKGPMWALGSTSNIQSFAVIASVNHLTIWADHDTAGLKAAETCRDRWQAARKQVEIFKPIISHRDFNDVWSARNGRL